VKKIGENETSQNAPFDSKELLLFGILISKKIQSILMVLISLLFLAEVIGPFRNYLISTGTVLLGLAAVGSYFRKHWVQYCFFAWSIFIYLKSLVLLLASVRSGATHILLLNTHIHMFILQCLIALPFFCAGYLAQFFFDESAKLPKNSRSENLALAYGVAICAFMSPGLAKLIANSSILPTPQTLVEQAITFNISEKWLLAVAALPHLIFNMVCSAVMVFMLAMLFRTWSRWHAVVTTSFIVMLFITVGVLNFLLMYMTEKWSSIWFFDGYETVLMPVSGIVLGILTGGLLAAFIKERI